MALTFVTPPPREVYGVDFLTNKGKVKFEFTETSTGSVGIALENKADSTVIPVTLVKTGNNYTAEVLLPIGKYEYYFTDSMFTNATPTKYQFSVGYVFVIVGHSLASSNGVQHATDDRVFIYNNYQAIVDSDWKTVAKYKGGAYRNPDDIYAAAVAANATDLYDTYQVGPWSYMAQLIAQRDNVDVAIINTAMGGSSLEMWADEAAQRPFKHGFSSTVQGVDDYNLYNSGIPYSHFENVMKVIGNRTGVTAVLIQHGENDMGKDSKMLGLFYKTFIDKMRLVSGLAGVPIVIAKSAWLLNSTFSATQSAIDSTLASVDEAVATINYSHVGPDTHLIPQSLRGQPNSPSDGHWNPEGSKEVGRLWSEKLTKEFLKKINNGISTIKPVTDTGVTPVVTDPTITTNNPTTGNTTNGFFKNFDLVLFGIVTVLGIGVMLLLKSLKVFAKIGIVAMVGIALVLGAVVSSIKSLSK